MYHRRLTKVLKHIKYRPNLYYKTYIPKKIWEFNKESTCSFMDFKKAYDSINRQSTFDILEEFRFTQKMFNLVKASLKDFNSLSKSRKYILERGIN